MASRVDPDARRYWLIAHQRLVDGQLLLERLNRSRAAIYMAGYAVECSLKALLVQSAPPAARAGVLRSFRGRGGHDLNGLQPQIAQLGIRSPVHVAKALSLASAWSVDLRYEPGDGNGEDAEDFLAAATSIVNWVDGKL